MMRKVIFTTLVLVIGLWSCSQDDDIKGVSDDYVDVTIGSETGGLKSIIGPGGATSWNVGDKVVVIDVDGKEQPFTYGSQTPKSSSGFNGELLSKQGRQVYKAYHAPENSDVTLLPEEILKVEMDNIEITEQGVTFNSALFGSYCPMLAIPAEFDAMNADDIKTYQFHHLTTMIEGRVSLRENNDEDAVYRAKTIDKVMFEVRAIPNGDGKPNPKPFNKEIRLDMKGLTTSSDATHLNDCIINTDDESVKKDYMYTIMNLKARTIEELLNEYVTVGAYFPIPIFALPTNDKFDYRATITFYHEGVLQLKMEGDGKATGLNPTGLNVLNFDHNKIIKPEVE